MSYTRVVPARPGVGEGGFEPPTSCSQSRCATAAPLPGLERAADRISTRERRRGRGETMNESVLQPPAHAPSTRIRSPSSDRRDGLPSTHSFALRHDRVLRVAGRGLPASKTPNRVKAEPASSARAGQRRHRAAAPAERAPRPPRRRSAPWLARISAPGSPGPVGLGRPGRAAAPSAARRSARPRRRARRAGAPAGPASGATASRPSPPAALAAEPTNTNGSSRCASCQAGTAVSAISTAV